MPAPYDDITEKTEGDALAYLGGDDRVNDEPVLDPDVFIDAEEFNKMAKGLSSVVGKLHRHPAEDQLVHNIAEASFDELVYTGSRVDAIITWETAAKLKKIREELISYTGSNATTITTKQYDAAGALLTTMTETITYSGSAVVSITRTVI